MKLYIRILRVTFLFFILVIFSAVVYKKYLSITFFNKITSTQKNSPLSMVTLPQPEDFDEKSQNNLFLIQEKLIEEKRQLNYQQLLEEQKQLEQQKLLEQQKAQEEVKKKQQTPPIATKKQIEIAQPPIQPSPQPKEQLLVEKIKNLGNAEQVIIVTSDAYKTIHSTISCFEKANGTWTQTCSMPGVIGINGFSSTKKEGDLTTPIGKFSLDMTFGKCENPGTKMPYRQVSANDIWADATQYYNTWVTDPSISGEHLLRDDWLYDYSLVINYNIPERILGKGSGIFLHCWRSSNNGTEGCVATDKNNVLSILKWLNPSKNPEIIEGPMSEVLKM